MLETLIRCKVLLEVMQLRLLLLLTCKREALKSFALSLSELIPVLEPGQSELLNYLSLCL